MIAKSNGFNGDQPAIDKTMMDRCIGLSSKAIDQGEMPFACLICRDAEILVEATNQVSHAEDITRHAEIVAISKAQQILGRKDLSDCTLYSTVEPCAMCAFAAREIRIGRVVFAIKSPMMGGVSKWNVLRDTELSNAMPEVFGPVPEVVVGLMQEEAERVWHIWNPLIWGIIKYRGYLGGRSAEAGFTTLRAIPERHSVLRRLFAFHNHAPDFFRKLRF
jgi:tRNA(adenine34) deaminase